MSEKKIYKIENISDKAYGETFEFQQKFWVKNVIQGEHLAMKLKKDQKFYLAEEIIVNSENRVKAGCSHFPQCGGCQLQHLEKESYQDFKIGILRKHIEKSGYKIPESFEFLNVGHYSRKKASFVIDYESNPVQIGFQREFSHQIIDIKECLILDKDIFEIMCFIRENLGDFIKTYQVKRLTITKVSEKIDLIFYHQKPFEQKTFEILLNFAKNQKICRISSSYQDFIDLVLELEPIEKIGTDYKIRLSPGFFMQSSAEIEEIIFNNVSKKIKEGEKILDLYSGFGFLTMKFAQFASVKACEISPPMVKNLREAANKFPRKYPLFVEERNLETNPIEAKSLKNFDHIIVNPPYKGFLNQAKELAKSGCPRITIVSCNPISFARDVYYLKQENYILENLIIIDQFLYSSHVELLALFVKS